jgi:DegV family protein with EDD domain
VTDSSSDLPPSVFAHADAICVPLDVRLGDSDPQELASLSGEEFWRRVAESDSLPTTAAPSPGDFAAAFAALHDQGCDATICITISSELSATHRSATIGARESGLDVAVIDSRTATMGQGLLVLEAMAARSTRSSPVDLLEHLLAERELISTFGTLENLESLRRGGRIGGAQAFVGTLLSIKPVIEVRDGRVEGESRQRTRARSLSYLATKIRAAGPLKRLAVVHAGADDVGDLISLIGNIPVDEPLTISLMGPVIGAHTGIGTIAIALERLHGDR